MHDNFVVQLSRYNKYNEVLYTVKEIFYLYKYKTSTWCFSSGRNCLLSFETVPRWRCALILLQSSGITEDTMKIGDHFIELESRSITEFRNALLNVRIFAPEISMGCWWMCRDKMRTNRWYFCKWWFWWECSTTAIALPCEVKWNFIAHIWSRTIK